VNLRPGVAGGARYRRAQAEAVVIVTLTVCAPPLAAIDEAENAAGAPAGKPVLAKLTVPG
jgi:hypothetical protein